MILFENVTKTYPRTTRPAVDHVSLEIARGEFVFVVGTSGSGKSTMLQLVMKEQDATGGRILVAGRDLDRLPDRKVPSLRRQIGCVFQDFRLLPNKTVHQNVAYALQVLGAPRSHPLDRARDARPRRPRRHGEALPAPALRWRAAARRDRPRLRQPAADPARRRADRQPRPRHQPRHRAAARPDQPHRHDRRHGHPRLRHRRRHAQARHPSRPRRARRRRRGRRLHDRQHPADRARRPAERRPAPPSPTSPTATTTATPRHRPDEPDGLPPIGRDADEPRQARRVPAAQGRPTSDR